MTRPDAVDEPERPQPSAQTPPTLSAASRSTSTATSVDNPADPTVEGSDLHRHPVLRGTSPARQASIGALAREGVSSAVAQPVSSSVAALILAAVCAVVFMTTGQAAASEARVIGRVEATGSRTLVFSDPSGAANLRAFRLEAIASLDGVEWILALGPPDDMTNMALKDSGAPVATRGLYTPLPSGVVTTVGRPTRPGEAVIGASAALAGGFEKPIGALTREQQVVPLVGGFNATSPLTTLNDVALVNRPTGGDAALQTLIVVARGVEDVPRLEHIVPGLLDVGDPTQLQVSSPSLLADLQRVVSGEVGNNTRRLMLLVLATGLVLVAVTQYGTMAARRRDYGRRRALGASRSDLMLVIAVQVLLCALVGILVGTVAGLALVRTLAGALPEAEFVIGVMVLVTLSAVVAAIPPAVAAARVDPVRILRVP